VKGVSILGATGTIGRNTLDVISRHQDAFRVMALTANSNDELLAAQCEQWGPECAVMADANAAERLGARLARSRPDVEVLSGVDGLERAAALPGVDMVMAGIVGAAGLIPSLAAARAGKRVLLANKEALVMSGMLFMQAVRQHGAELLPIDSEHNAIFQCMPPGFGSGLDAEGVERILLTASGGPFRDRSAVELENVTPAEACAHPNWVMGRKISVDSATMMNKGLELVEACWLFSTTADRVQVVLHPQSIIHSLVEYRDGSVLAQLGNPDMRTPIAHALAWPRRITSGVEPLDLAAIGTLEFYDPDFSRFPCLGLAYQVARQGGSAPAILNAANEVAVQAFLDERLGFTEIPAVIESTLSTVTAGPGDSLEGILADDATARSVAGDVVRLRASRGM
jgi:1-deoxy-D-xylulose-5-phosphate reductoisomerase